MPLTIEFRKTVMADIRRDAAYRREMLAGALEELLAGDVAVARTMLRDLINATLGFEALAERVNLPPKSLMRMFGPNGNPQANNLLAVIAALRDDAGVKLSVSVEPVGGRRARKPRLEFAEPRAIFRRR